MSTRELEVFVMRVFRQVTWLQSVSCEESIKNGEKKKS